MSDVTTVLSQAMNDLGEACEAVSKHQQIEVLQVQDHKIGEFHSQPLAPSNLSSREADSSNYPTCSREPIF